MHVSQRTNLSPQSLYKKLAPTKLVSAPLAKRRECLITLKYPKHSMASMHIYSKPGAAMFSESVTFKLQL